MSFTRRAHDSTNKNNTNEDISTLKEHFVLLRKCRTKILLKKITRKK